MSALTPTAREWQEARAQALRVICRKYADIAHEADMIVDDAIAESLPRFVVGSFAALVTQTAARRAMNRLRDLAADKAAYDVLRSEAEEAFEATSPEHETRQPAEATITMEQTREATLVECRRRLAKAVGGGTLIDTVREASETAWRILRLANEAPGLMRLVDAEALARIAGDESSVGRRECRYVDASGVVRVYGHSHAEAAVLAILAGSWPQVRVGALPSDVIDDRASAIRMAKKAAKAS